MSETNIKEIIFPQKFSSHGVRLDELVEHRVLVNFFVNIGFGGTNFIYATDVAKLKAHYDGDRDGKISLGEARQMGMQGNDKEILAALQFLDIIVSHELTAEQDSFPLKISDREVLQYDRNGKLLSRTYMDESEFSEFIYRDGNPNRVMKKYLRRPDGTLHFIEYNEIDLSKIQSEALISPSGTKLKRVYSYDQRNKLKSYYETGNNYNKTTILDDYGRCVFVRENLGNIVKRITNIYDDAAHTMLQETEGDPQLLREGVMRKQCVYETDKGRKTDKLVSELNILINGKSVQIQ
ncbi:MAG: hypothetical protein LBK53_05055 [Heliobacteriaceae bacterium]|jgi:hypothetical protein|nr:hypothetical protein [Heliobacteriaceae bacterium]